MILVSCLRFSLAVLIMPYFLCGKKNPPYTSGQFLELKSLETFRVPQISLYLRKRRGSKPSNFIALLVSLTLKTS